MSNFGPNAKGYNLVLNGPGNSADGTLLLQYDTSNITSSNGASLTYWSSANAQAQGPYTFTFTGSGPYSASGVTLSPNLNIPGQGGMKSTSVSFSPPTSNPSFAGTLSGTFAKSSGSLSGDEDVPWEADSGSGEEAEIRAKTASPSKY